MASSHQAKLLASVCILYELEEVEKRKKNDKMKRWWVRQLNRQRRTQGDFLHLVQELRTDEEQFNLYFRMSPQIFDELLALVGPSLRRQDTQMRQSVGPAERLAITLRRLATGDSPQSIAFAYRRGASTVRAVVYDTCNALWRVLVPTYMKAPSQPSDWKKISEGFAYTWNFPNCIGALDGKHIAIQAPRNSGSLYFNYKKDFSLVLMALCDSQYKFIFVDIGEAGRWSDGGVFANSQFGSAFLNGEMHLPADEPLPGTNESLPILWLQMRHFLLKPG
ncbi:uncharacterized protein LOC124435166 [Xenia sp. Carnegie-2017]|uniref:uncharacterized protein LOC124435166 n=1 Tax=Xenia sp. Carnegie-2017 TaxID=2897299 RepID=UPI001F03618D|nr:uncharacterized protein LOC124435166 [Xenia sp. Carnegie-2017]